MPRLDHVAYRLADRWKAAEFFIKAFGYQIQDKFPIDFGNGDFANCISLSPPQAWPEFFDLANSYSFPFASAANEFEKTVSVEFHMAPEIFVSDGTPSSIVGQWVGHRGGVGGIHHMAYEVDNVWSVMAFWKSAGLATFTSEPIVCEEEGLTQVFTEPHPITGMVYELITRKERGFCKASVKRLMESSVGHGP